jgi:regulatory protein
VARPAPSRARSERPPLDAAGLERLALHYVGRYATTRAKLREYLARKLRERGWSGDDQAPIAALAEKIAGLGYIDDRAFAAARGAALTRRGYGGARVAMALRAAGIEEDDAAPVRETAAGDAWEAAIAFARRRRIGPFARAESGDPDTQRRAMAAMMRAGHAPGIARRLCTAAPGEVPEPPERGYV